VVGYLEEVMDTPSVSPHRVTQLLAEWSDGDAAALVELTPLGYGNLTIVIVAFFGFDNM